MSAPSAIMGPELLAAVVGVVGSGLVAFAIFVAQIRNAKSSAALELLKEFNGTEISEARARAYRHVVDAMKQGRSEWEEPENPPQSGLSANEYLYIVGRFFHRVEAARRAKLVPEDELLIIFGPTFGYWWGFSFAPQQEREDNFRIKQDLKSLHQFFEGRSRSEFKRCQWETWIDDGRKARAAIAEQASNTPVSPH